MLPICCIRVIVVCILGFIFVFFHPQPRKVIVPHPADI